jgi:hypothetical protein
MMRVRIKVSKKYMILFIILILSLSSVAAYATNMFLYDSKEVKFGE